jgi:hypothetical protein
MWWQLEDYEIEKRLEGIKDDLKNNKYPLKYYKDIIVYLFQLKYNGFTIHENEYVDLMVNNTVNVKEAIDIDKLELISDDKNFIKSYNELMEPVFANLRKKQDGELFTEINTCFDSIETWGDNFCEYCFKHKQEFLTNHRFFYSIDISKLLECLNNATLKDIYDFISAMNEIYSFSNLNDFFINDLANLSAFAKNIPVEHDTITRKMALKRIRDRVEEVMQNLNK